jgi:hypothetical protein
MIRIAGIAALGLAFNACPVGSTHEEPDGYANITGSVVLRDGSPYSGPGHAVCWRPPDEQLAFSMNFRVERGSYEAVLEAPFGSMSMQGLPPEFLCRVQAAPSRVLIARRYASVPFSRVRADRLTTRIDLRAGEIEEEP